MLKKVVFDIECVGKDFESLDEKTKHDLLRHLKTEEEKEEEKEKLALWPPTGEIVAIGMLNPDTDGGQVLYTAPQAEKRAVWEEEGKTYHPCASEEELLRRWWEDVARYDQVISFNGRAFDAPYILFRSMVYGISPSKNLMPNRYGDYRTGFNAHLDLADQLSYYGATRRFSLHIYTTALGITSPKEEGVDGLAVPRLYREGEYETIARYCLRDVAATAELYRRWQTIAD